MFPIKQTPPPSTPHPHLLNPLPILLIFPQEPQMLGCKSNVSSRSVVCTVRNKNAGTKSKEQDCWRGGDCREKAQGGREGGVNTSVPLKPSEETDLSGEFLLFIIIKGNNPSLAKSTNYSNFREERIVREARNNVQLLS